MRQSTAINTASLPHFIQKYIYSTLTGIQYINLVADIFKVDLDTRKTLTQKYAEALEIKNELNSQISTYSHGMRQKLVLIASFVHSPKLLVLDEPFVGLDPITAHEFKEIMKEEGVNNN